MSSTKETESTHDSGRRGAGVRGQLFKAIQYYNKVKSAKVYAEYVTQKVPHLEQSHEMYHMIHPRSHSEVEELSCHAAR